MPTIKLTASKLLLPALLLTLQGCTNSLKVEGDFPKPLIRQAAQSAAVYYDEDFRTYTYTEKSEDRGKWIIETGNAQMQLFNGVLAQLFDGVEEIDRLPDQSSPATADLVIRPKLLEFQYSIPRETRFKVYEVWLKYNISAFDPRGTLFADWIITGYGKTPTAFMLSEEKAMNAAAVVALRDLGANLSLTTMRVPEIKAWVETRSRILANSDSTTETASATPAASAETMEGGP